MNRINLCLLIWITTSSSSLFAEEPGLELFEKKIRPVLMDYCYKCHSADADEPAGGLLLDTREGIRAGGESGPAVVPKDVEESLIISAIEYRDLEMPPDEKLDKETVADFQEWIRLGAPDPRDKTNRHKHSVRQPPIRENVQANSGPSRIRTHNWREN